MKFGINGTKPNRIFHSVQTLDIPTVEQFRDCLDQEFAVKGALMADAHLGYTMPIGGVIATENVLVPSWVGYDIGCGVLAYRTDFDPSRVRERSHDIFHQIRRDIPLGFKHHKYRSNGAIEDIARVALTQGGYSVFNDKGGTKQLGTLGGGNHFIEIGESTKGEVYIIIHSGSRGVGHGIATHYIKAAHPDGKCKEGSFGLVGGTELFDAYLKDMEFCLDFALENRMHMLKAVLSAMYSVLDYLPEEEEPIEIDRIINRNHNHAVLDKPTGLWVHRKGATHAEEGMFGVIPGNMKDGCIITVGKGHPDSLSSSSHGAGRAMSRTKAKAELDPVAFRTQMDGITCSTKGNLDEAPGAYKNFNEVISEQEGLLFDIVDIVRPIINVKG